MANYRLRVGLDPLTDALNLISEAKAAGHMWVRLDNGTQTFSAAWPAVTYRDANAGYPAIIYAWAGFAWDDTNHRIILFGGGHANSSANEVFTWSAASRGWSLAFYGSEHINVQPGPNTHRVKGFNDAPVSSHTYCNNVWLSVQKRFLTLGGSGWNDGGALKVFDSGIPGNQPGLRAAGAFSLDMTLAGQGYTAGATGTNPGPSLPGANAWRLHDWMAPGHPSPPIFDGNNYVIHGDRGAVATVEGGVDVVYNTAGSNYGLVRSQITDSNPINDVNTLICNGLDVSGDGETLPSGNLAFDPVDRVFCMLTLGAGSFEPIRFVDLKRAPGTRSFRRPNAPTGQAALKSEPKGEPGILWDPIDNCFVGATRGSFISPGIFASGGVWKITKPAPESGLTPDSGWTIARRDPTAGPTPPMIQWPGESFVQVAGRWRWANSLRVGLYLTDPTNGQVWAYIPENWTDPRL